MLGPKLSLGFTLIWVILMKGAVAPGSECGLPRTDDVESESDLDALDIDLGNPGQGVHPDTLSRILSQNEDSLGRLRTLYPGTKAAPTPNDWTPELNSIGLRRQAWNDFIAGLGGKKTNPVENFIEQSRMVIQYTADINRLFKLLQDMESTSIGKQIWAKLQEAFIDNVMIFYTNPNYKPSLPSSAQNKPGLFDNSVLSPPPGTSPEAMRANVEILLKKMFSFDDYNGRSNDIILSDDVFLAAWQRLRVAYGLANKYLTDLLNPFMKEDVENRYPKLVDRLTPNTLPRPAGLWRRQGDPIYGYEEYYCDKYGKIYTPLGAGINWWRRWKYESTPGVPVPTLLLALHGTITGLIRGSLAFIFELMADISLRANELSLNSSTPDPTFAILDILKGKTGSEICIPDNVFFLKRYPERYGSMYLAMVPGYTRGQEDWDDEAEMKKFTWREVAQGSWNPCFKGKYDSTNLDLIDDHDSYKAALQQKLRQLGL
ncbi:hypothetical protein H072_6927 [Dactylellina haptotyla CBS 200.50]|uniref:Uncharacterized protein n=1 Tax=Dactylellina haptotyla (strain CBS 200.50) TaxID=1284197 RepID=S8BVD2_DACHA|nr:hypothetical protein H072_6927 [Dactylellina haptotyla CBS 200.50]